MNILFDSQIFGLQRYGGISRYIIELACELNKIKDVNARIVAPIHLNEILQTSTTRHFGIYVPKESMRGGIRRRLDLTASRLWESISPHDILHTTYYLRHHRAKRRSPVIVTVHDMIHERFPESFPADDPTARMKLAAIKAADHIICVSESTRRDLLELCSVNTLQTTVIHHGVRLPEEQLLSDASSRRSNFLLYVGQRGGYKNFRQLLEAYASSRRLKADFTVVAFGGGSFTSAEKELIDTLNLNGQRVVQCAGDDSQLGTLYQQAAAFVYPSRYEGFGMPVLEAMAFGCPVIASATSSIPEAGGDAVEYFDPSNSESLVNALEKVLYSSERTIALVKKGYQRAAAFTWSRTARATFDLYSQVLG